MLSKSKRKPSKKRVIFYTKDLKSKVPPTAKARQKISPTKLVATGKMVNTSPVRKTLNNGIN